MRFGGSGCCGPRQADERAPLRDEGPSTDDLNRFGSDTGYCPGCGGEVYDQAPYCPHCGEVIEGGVLSRPPEAHEITGRWLIVVSIVLLLSMFACVLIFRS